MKQRYRITVAYRGTRYHGWQAQTVPPTYEGPTLTPAGPGTTPHLPTVQASIEAALLDVVRHKVHVTGSSRTDTGVHAKGQLAQFDTTMTQIPPAKLKAAVNARLPGDILIRTLEPVPDSFNVITDVTHKRYQYAIWHAEDRPVFFGDLAWHVWQPLDVEAMQTGARHFVGTHDFASVCKPGHGREHTVRTISEFTWSRRGPRLVAGIAGSGFLWHQIRIMVGTLVEVGLGRLRADAIPEMLSAKTREAAGPTAPPHGLYLQWIRTKEDDRRTTDAHG